MRLQWCLCEERIGIKFRTGLIKTGREPKEKQNEDSGTKVKQKRSEIAGLCLQQRVTKTREWIRRIWELPGIYKIWTNVYEARRNTIMYTKPNIIRDLRSDQLEKNADS